VFDFGGISASDENHGAFNVFFTPTSGFTDAMAAISSSDPGFSNEARARADSILAAGVLHHIAVTLDDEEIRLYHDGELIASATYASAPDDPIPSIAQLDDSVAYLGRSTYGEDDLLTGEIVEFAIFDVALTPAEILARFERTPEERGASAQLPQDHHAELAAGDDVGEAVAVDVAHGEGVHRLIER
jgi:large repetitive protein